MRKPRPVVKPLLTLPPDVAEQVKGGVIIICALA